MENDAAKSEVARLRQLYDSIAVRKLTTQRHVQLNYDVLIIYLCRLTTLQ
jgi:hypothetical protein